MCLNIINEIDFTKSIKLVHLINRIYNNSI
jgi:hypothetical protein